MRAAVRLGPDGDRLLSALGAPMGWRGVYVCAALGDVRGPHGAAVLRQVVDGRGSGTSDRRCAALLALAKRGEGSAVEVLVDALGDRDAAVREYALIGLAAVGDDRAWEPVRARLEAVLARRRWLPPPSRAWCAPQVRTPSGPSVSPPSCGGGGTT